MKTGKRWQEVVTASMKQLVLFLMPENDADPMGWRRAIWMLLGWFFLIQTLTGLVMWMFYSPSTHTAWESVFYLQHEIPMGWWIRGIHYWAAECMVVASLLLLTLYISSIGSAASNHRSYLRALWITGIIITLAIAGYLLPWDQHGFWSAKIRTHIMGLTPVIGSGLERLMLGGTELGHYTLTRFFALHAGWLPILLWLGLRMGRSPTPRAKGLKDSIETENGFLWGTQSWRCGVAIFMGSLCVGILAWQPWAGDLEGALRGAPLSAPVNAAEPYPAARPEWYFLFLYQFLKYFPGPLEVVGAIFIPNLILLWLVFLPMWGKSRIGRRVNQTILAFLCLGVCLLSIVAIHEDRQNTSYLRARKEADSEASRARELAASLNGIPHSGALTLLLEDPQTQGPKLFAEHCSSCHRYDRHDGRGLPVEEAPSASDLAGFASRTWLSQFLSPDHILTPAFFGHTSFKDGEMATFITETIASFDSQKRQQLEEVIHILSAEAQLPAQKHLETSDAAWRSVDRDALFYEVGCTECHGFHFEDEDLDAPDLTGYGSREWLIDFISNPSSERFYGEQNDRMPAYLEEGILNQGQISLIVDWLRGQ